MPPLLLALAVKQPDFETVRVLFEAYPGALLTTDRCGRNALHVVLQNEEVSVHLVQLLLQHGLPRQLLSQRAKGMGMVPLHLALISIRRMKN